MSIKFISKVFDDQTLKSSQKLIMLAIADNATDNEGESGTCYPSIKTLAKKCGLSTRSIINNIDKLVENGYLKRAYRSRAKGGRSSNKYLIYPEITLTQLDAQNAMIFSKDYENSYSEQRAKMKEVHSVKISQSEESSPIAKVKKVHKGSEGDSLTPPTQSEGSSQESEPSLNNNHQDNRHLVPASGKPPAPTTIICASYVEGMRQRYGNQINPARNAKINGMLKNMIERIGLENASIVARNYPMHQNSWYVQKTHSIEAMLQDCESLLIQVQSGQMVTKTQAYKADRDGEFLNSISQHSKKYNDSEAF